MLHNRTGKRSISAWNGDDYSTMTAIDSIGRTACQNRVTRGGHWRNGADYCRAANRSYAHSSGYGYIGFCVVLYQ